MNPLWLETTGKITLILYLALIGGCLLALVVRATVRPASAMPGIPSSRFARILIEYFGNTGPRERRQGSSAVVERRQNMQARFLMDHIRDEMIRRDVTSTETEELIEGLRQAMRSEEQGQPN